ncbi:hypothetical protein DFH09DRAFT_1099805 [Mycena vulgaris]|nr:hypothetical protein DFH09DRAFT_1099805 [Mycena vulgaris]
MSGSGISKDGAPDPERELGETKRKEAGERDWYAWIPSENAVWAGMLKSYKIWSNKSRMRPLAVFDILARRVSGGLARHVSGGLAQHISGGLARRVSVVLARCVSIMRIDECRHAPRSTRRPRGVGGVTDGLVRPDGGACALASRGTYKGVSAGRGKGWLQVSARLRAAFRAASGTWTSRECAWARTATCAAENQPEDEMRTNMCTVCARCSPREYVSSDGVDVLLSHGLDSARASRGT